MTRILVVDDARNLSGVDDFTNDLDDAIETIVVSWNTFSSSSMPTHKSQVVHLGDLLHDRGDVLQRSLLHWLGALAEKHTSDFSRLPFIFPNLHSWWLLRVSEKNYATSPEFTSLLKLSLLRDICEKSRATHCDFTGSDRRLESAIHYFALENGLATNARADAHPETLAQGLEVAQALFHFLQAFGVALANLLRRAKRLAKSRLLSAPKSSAEPVLRSTADHPARLGFVGYLLPMQSSERAHSPYWGSLRETLTLDQTSLWLYHRSDEVSRRDGRTFCSQNENDRESHHIIDDFITLGVVVGSIRAYLRLYRARLGLNFDVSRSTSELGGLGAQQLFRDALRDSTIGSHAVWAVIQAHTYDSLVQHCDVKRWFYLWENKHFEQSLVSAAQRHDNIETIGYSHSVVRQQDNRYYNELHFVPVADTRSRPTASIYAINGSLPLQNIQRVAPPGASLREVEALRYLSLTPREKSIGDAVLVVGDISAIESKRLVIAIVAALTNSALEPKIIFKPHPGNLSQTDMAREFGCEISTRSLAELAPLTSFAVVGVAGAASLDLTMLGVPVITLLNAHTMNMSPLAGAPGAIFARDIADLEQFAKSAHYGSVDVSILMTRSQPPIRWLALLSGSK